MISNTTILSELQGSTAHIWLNRPAIHNALNGDMIGQLLMTLRNLNDNPAIRIIIIRGKGPSFCTGADLTWMQQSANLSAEENISECNELAMCFYEIFTSRKITIAMVHGMALGGGIGLIAAADMAFALESSEFGFSEIRVGLIPATIAPYIIRKTGYAKARELMLTGRKFSAMEAEQNGLVNRTLSSGEFETYTNQVINELKHGAPIAQESMKAYLNTLDVLKIDKPAVNLSARLIAEARIAPEASEGISAFREKRKPIWYHD